MSAVIAAINDGALGRDDIARRTRLERTTVDAVIERLEAMGQLRREGLNSACPTDGCGTCSSNGACSIQKGPVALVLSRRLGT